MRTHGTMGKSRNFRTRCSIHTHIHTCTRRAHQIRLALAFFALHLGNHNIHYCVSTVIPIHSEVFIVRPILSFHFSNAFTTAHNILKRIWEKMMENLTKNWFWAEFSLDFEFFDKMSVCFVKLFLNLIYLVFFLE